MVYPRQRLYDVNHGAFLKSLVTGTINAPARAEDGLEQRLREDFLDYTGISDLIPLSRGRLAVYFAARYSVTSERKKILMSPFTIFDLVNMVRVAGGEPFFLDSVNGSPHCSAATIAEAIDDSTAAVIVTHYHSTNREIAKIAEICRERGIKLIEDCAISLGARVDGRHVGSFGDFALFSFGLFKFISTYFGGGLAVSSAQTRSAIHSQLRAWPRMTAGDLYPYFAKGIKLTALTRPAVFNGFTFPVFRFGYLRNIDFIKRNAQNDPDPILRDVLPDQFKRRPSLFQLREFIRQLPLVEKDRVNRLANASRYWQRLVDGGVGGLPEKPDPEIDCYLNFPVVLGVDRDAFVSEMMRSGYDLAIYYYRNCAEIDAFREYHRDLPNIGDFVSRIVFFPTYPGVDPGYIDALSARAAELIGAR